MMYSNTIKFSHWTHIMCRSDRFLRKEDKDGLRRGGARRELKKRGMGMNGRLDKSMGIVTLIPEVLTKIKPTDHLIFSKRVSRKKRNYSDSSGNSPAKVLTSRCGCKKIRRTKSSYTRTEVPLLTATRKKKWSGRQQACETGILVFFSQSRGVVFFSKLKA